MIDSQPNPVELAKQGDVKAIAFLINRSLHPKSITAKVILKDGCLQIMLEAAQIPDQQTLAPFIHKGVTGLKSVLIKKLIVFGRQVGEKIPGWSQEFDIGQSTFSPSSVVNDPVQKVNIPQAKFFESTNLQSSSQAKLLEQSDLTLKNKSQDEMPVVKEQTLIECKGDNGIIILTNLKVIIKRMGGLLTPHKKGEKYIPYTDILDFQYQKSTLLSMGYVYLQLSGLSKEITLFEASSSENAVTFLNEKLKDFDKVKETLVQKINPQKYDNVFEGRSGTLVITDTGIIMKRSGGLLSGHTSAEKNIPYKNITAVQFKRAGFTVGFIQFTLKGAGEAKGGVFEAVTDENTVTFANEEKTREFEKAKNLIEERILRANNASSMSQTSNDFEQLEKLAALRDKGIVTEAEFEAKKKQILGL